MNEHSERRPTCEEIIGTGSCPQAQADGVPCTELGRACEICEAARPSASSGSSLPAESTECPDALEW